MKNDIHCSGKCSCRFSWFPIIPWASHHMILRWPLFPRSHTVCMLTAFARLISLNKRFSIEWFFFFYVWTVSDSWPRAWGTDGKLSTDFIWSFGRPVPHIRTSQRSRQSSDGGHLNVRYSSTHRWISVTSLLLLRYAAARTIVLKDGWELAFHSHGMMLFYFYLFIYWITV